MDIPCYRSSAPDRWTLPRPHSDASSRLHKFGPLMPMDEPKRRFAWLTIW